MSDPIELPANFTVQRCLVIKEVFPDGSTKTLEDEVVVIKDGAFMEALCTAFDRCIALQAQGRPCELVIRFPRPLPW